MLALCGIPLLGLGALYCLVASCHKEPIKGGHPHHLLKVKELDVSVFIFCFLGFTFDSFQENS